MLKYVRVLKKIFASFPARRRLIQASRYAATIIIRGYQLFLSPLIGPCCRFHPSCSDYALEAINRYGIFRGFYLGARRLLKCHPWHSGGFDPVP